MADLQHVKILKQGVKKWNAWRKENPEIEPDLSDLDFNRLLTKNDANLVDFNDVNQYSVSRSRLNDQDRWHKVENLIAPGSEPHERWADWSAHHQVVVSREQSRLIEREVSILFHSLIGVLAHVSIEGWDVDRTYSSLVGIDLSRTNLFKARFEGVCIYDADLSMSNLSQTHFASSLIIDVDFSNSVLDETIITYSNFSRSTMRNAQINRVVVRDSILSELDCSHASLRKSSFYNARFSRSDLSSTDFREATCFTLDETIVSGMRFPRRPADPWTKLRRRYSGPASTINYVLIGLYFVPILINAFFLWSLTITQERLLNVLNQSGSIEVIQNCRAPNNSIDIVQNGEIVSQIDCRSDSVFSVLFGFDGSLAWFWVLFGLFLLVYQIIRLVFTRNISLLRDREERSGITPEYSEYAHMSTFTEKVLVGFERFSLIFVTLRAVHFLFFTSIVSFP